jgi:hypothetical protein
LAPLEAYEIKKYSSLEICKSWEVKDHVVTRHDSNFKLTLNFADHSESSETACHFSIPEENVRQWRKVKEELKCTCSTGKVLNIPKFM